MITLPNTLQEIFDIVAIHLLTQGKQSISNGYCSYRGSDGTKCAAGALIPDDQYDCKFERLSWRDLVQKQWVENKFACQIQNLQSIHDSAEDDPNICLNQWKDSLQTFAKSHCLNLPSLKELKS